ncbi:hypothetical protein C5L31_000282 [Secundilactobacillus malefermentans]|uniref:Uncharacterized protein n=1 Tax=Secundilactobacillus malefermentans TaxID=176292 RepID=A0A4R5NFU5_9LACO|nr:hypothetical protein C5L31_000282 [Secundilactobacillus malefermentans]
MGTCGLLIYKKILLIDYHSGNPSTGKSIEPNKLLELSLFSNNQKEGLTSNQVNPSLFSVTYYELDPVCQGIFAASWHL